jgi:hypothetical protein
MTTDQDLAYDMIKQAYDVAALKYGKKETDAALDELVDAVTRPSDPSDTGSGGASSGAGA